MNLAIKIVFWSMTIALGFVNPLISFGLIVLYYLPEMIQSLCHRCNDSQKSESYSGYEEDLEINAWQTNSFESADASLKQFSEDTLREMR